MHKCVKCERSHDDAPVLEGCECGSKVFIFMRNSRVSGDGRYDLDVAGMLRDKQSVEQKNEGTYEIDIKAAFEDPTFKKSS